MKEVYPNITWGEESKKIFYADEFSKGEASMIRSFEAAIRLLEQSIRRGNDPLRALQNTREWLTKCLYSNNYNNFN